jgi:hypothetical protein
MDQWVLAKDFIAADVIRWKEGVFDKRRRRGKDLRIGERLVAAEVLQRGEDGWVKLLVRACAITKDEMAGKAVQSLKAGEQIRRASKTILRGKVERLLWDDESARAAVLASKSAKSRFADLPIEE